VAEASYYARRAARDPAWRQTQVAAAAKRYRRQLEHDPEQVAAWSRRYREQLRDHALTISQLRERAHVEHEHADRQTLRRILREEVEAGRVELVQGRYYRLNGSLPDDVVAALRQIA
jgi:glycine/D-amino acid oxidase-like deaminating enzyme